MSKLFDDLTLEPLNTLRWNLVWRFLGTRRYNVATEWLALKASFANCHNNAQGYWSEWTSLCRVKGKHNCVPVLWAGSSWPSGKDGKRKGLGSKRFGSPFSSKVVVCGQCLVTLSLAIYETLSLSILIHESFWWWQCSDRYIISLFPHLHTPSPRFSPSLISLMVSVDVKHHVYLLSPRLSGSFVV